MKFTLSLVALVATAYAAPVPLKAVQSIEKETFDVGTKATTEVGTLAKPVLTPAEGLAHKLDITRRQVAGGPVFYDAGSVVQKLTNPVQLDKGIPEVLKAKVEHIVRRAADVAPEDDCEEGEEGSNVLPPAPAGAPTAANPNPNVQPVPGLADSPAGSAPAPAETNTPASWSSSPEVSHEFPIPAPVPAGAPTAANPTPGVQPLVEPVGAPTAANPDPNIQPLPIDTNPTSPSDPTGVEPCEEEEAIPTYQ